MRRKLSIERIRELKKEPSYLEKIEKNRLIHPCSRQIDMRSKVDAKCFEYNHHGITHYLDSRSKDLFLKAVERNKGRYTVAVYEIVVNAPHTIKNKIEHQVDPNLTLPDEEEGVFEGVNIPQIFLGYQSKRAQVRLRIAGDIEIHLADGSVYQGKTKDLSSRGLKATIHTHHPLSVGALVQLKFKTHKIKPLPKRAEGFSYLVVGVEDEGNSISVRLAIPDDLYDREYIEALDVFLEKNKEKYLMDAEDSLLAMEAEIYGNLYAPFSQYIRFFASRDKSYKSPIVITTSRSAQMVGDWVNDKTGAFERLLTATRMSELAKGEVGSKDLQSLIFTFYDEQSGHRYCASEVEFKSQTIRSRFIGVGQSFPTWQVISIRMGLITQEMEDSLHERAGSLGLSAKNSELYKKLKRYSHVGALLDITDQYPHHHLPVDDVERTLQMFVAFRQVEKPETPLAIYDFGQQVIRQEPRYALKTQVIVATKKQGQLTGVTQDISINGMSLLLSKPCTVKEGEPVSVLLNAIAKKVTGTKLGAFYYKVVSVNEQGDILRLMHDDSPRSDKNKRFLKVMLEKNAKKLAVMRGTIISPMEAKLVSNLMTETLPSMAFYVNTDGAMRRWVISRVAISSLSAKLSRFFKVGEHHDFSAFADKNVVQDTLEVIAGRRSKSNHTQLECYVYKAFQNDKDVIYSALETHFEEESQRIEFVKKASEHSEHLFLKISIHKADEIDIESVVEALVDLNKQAPHRCIDIRKRCKTLVAIGEITDLTESISLRDLGAD